MGLPHLQVTPTPDERGNVDFAGAQIHGSVKKRGVARLGLSLW